VDARSIRCRANAGGESGVRLVQSSHYGMLHYQKIEQVTGMLVCDGKLRLTAAEKARFLRDTGKSKVPDTPEEYASALRDSAAYWAQEETAAGPEGELLAFLLEQDAAVADSLAAKGGE